MFWKLFDFFASCSLIHNVQATAAAFDPNYEALEVPIAGSVNQTLRGYPSGTIPGSGAICSPALIAPAAASR